MNAVVVDKIQLWVHSAPRSISQIILAQATQTIVINGIHVQLHRPS
jgi:hypothetical protein